jgi:hypothetical protein
MTTTNHAPQSYFVVGGNAYWFTYEANAPRPAWFEAAIDGATGVPDFANYAEIYLDMIDQPFKDFFDGAFTPWCHVLQRWATAKAQSDLYPLIMAVNDAFNLDIASLTTTEVGAPGVTFRINSWTFVIAQDVTEGFTTQIGCYEPTDNPVNSVWATFDGWGTKAWMTDQFKAFLRTCVNRVVTTHDFTYIEADKAIREAQMGAFQ